MRVVLTLLYTSLKATAAGDVLTQLHFHQLSDSAARTSATNSSLSIRIMESKTILETLISKARQLPQPASDNVKHLIGDLLV